MSSKNKIKVFIINGSASKNSSNEKLIHYIETENDSLFTIKIADPLSQLPPFDPSLMDEEIPEKISAFKNSISDADAVLFCTPEYIFSIPSGLKNILEWCVSSTVFSDKPIGIITASASGIKGHEELQLILKTLMAKFDEKVLLLIQGIKGKINEQGEIIDSSTKEVLATFFSDFYDMVIETSAND